MPRANPPAATGTSPQPTTRRKMRRRRKDKVTSHTVPPGGGTNTGGPNAGGGHSTGGGQPGGSGQPGGGSGSSTSIYDLGAQLGNPKTVKQLVKQALRGQYGPALQQARTDARRVPQYFEDYRARLAQVQGQQQGMYAATMGGLGQFAQQAGAGAAQAIAAGQQAQAQGAAVTGANPSAQVGQQAGQAAAVRAGMAGDMAGLLANQGLAQGNHLANRSVSSVPLEMQARQDARNVVRGLRQEKGAARAEILSALRQEFEERRQADRNFRLVQREFGLDQANAAVDAADTVADNKRAEREARQERREERRERREERGDVNEYGVRNDVWKRMTYEQRRAIIKDNKNLDDNGDGNSGSSDRDEKREERREEHKEGVKLRRDIAGLWRQYAPKIGTLQPVVDENNNPVLVDGKPQMHRVTESDVLDRIASRTDYSTNEIRLVALMAQGVRLSPADRRLAKSLGIPLPLKLRRPTHTAHKNPKDRPGPQGH